MPIVKQSDIDELERLRANERAYLDWRDSFIRLLHSEKFRGTDVDGGRKDWIATKDVLDWLECLEAVRLDREV
jgi:hypothetical protein